MTAEVPAAPPPEVIRDWVKQRYSRAAREEGCCAPSRPPSAGATVARGETDGCCGVDAGSGGGACGGTGHAAAAIGYGAEDLAGLPSGADLGLGCGNPTAIAELRPGEVVLDLGSGAGIDVFLAAKRVGSTGRVIGVDMTPAMVERARENARNGAFEQVEFRLGEIEHLPVADASVDVVISNCVINLAADKSAVYREAFRVLRPGGRLIVSDMVATRPIAPEARADSALWASCSSGALDAGSLTATLRTAGFVEVAVTLRGADRPAVSLGDAADLGVYAAEIRARRPEP